MVMIPIAAGNPYRLRLLLFLLVVVCQVHVAAGQQVPDTLYRYPVGTPTWMSGEGPRVLIDEGHHNFHTRKGGFLPFSRLLEDDGYRVDGYGRPFERAVFPPDCRILVIANALDKSDSDEWVTPNPSAFTRSEIRFLKSWVEAGGSLFLIADHMPFAGAASELAEAFGFRFLNGFAFSEATPAWPPSVFSTIDGTLPDSPVSKGLCPDEIVTRIATFTGSCFAIPKGATGVLRFPAGSFCLMPDTAWAFRENTPRRDIPGYFQGAIASFGKGKMAVFGEAAMFTAQLANGLKAGFNSDAAPQNARFLLNLVHWLDIPTNPYHLSLVTTARQYENAVSADPAMQMVNLSGTIPGIDLDIRYASSNNFTRQVIYAAPQAWLRKPVALALEKVQDSLAGLGLGLRIYDAYRPYAATMRFYQVYPDTTFVANPRSGSRHNRGCAVDLTLINLKTGKEIPMPTDFDDFSPKASPDFRELPDTVLVNRKFLFNLMDHFGFTHYPTEWWHFDYAGWEKFPLMDVPFEILEQKNL